MFISTLDIVHVVAKVVLKKTKRDILNRSISSNGMDCIIFCVRIEVENQDYDYDKCTIV